MTKIKTIAPHAHDEDDAPKLTRAWLAKATSVTPPTRLPPVTAIRKTVRDGVVHATVMRGGARPGAGRKPHEKPSERFTLTLSHEIAAKVHAAARRNRMKDASFLAELVAAHA